SWPALRGRCANCGARIAFRYFAVELLTALLFLIIWKAFPWQIAIAYWGFVALVIAATFIDFEHYIIPDEITIGGTIAGLIASTAVPQLMTTDRRLNALLISAASAAVGYALLWLVLDGGKLVFGKKRIRIEKSAAFTWARHDDDADYVVDDENRLRSDFFGRGDLKFLACICAFLGWRSVLFAIFAGSLFGSVIGLITLVLGRRVWSLKLPFGPYLAFGAITWMFFGDSVVRWYQTLLSP